MQNKLSGLLVSDFTSDVLKAFLVNLPESPSCSIVLAPFGGVISVLEDPSNSVWKDPYDFVVVWTQAAAVVPLFQKILYFEEVPLQELSSECDVFINAVKEAADRGRFVFVITWSLPEFFRGYGPIDLRKTNGWRYALLTLNKRLAEGLADVPNVYLLSAEKWLQAIGEKACDPRLWFMSKIPFDPSVFKLAAQDIKAALRACLGETRKLIIVDLDNTLWGGVVGDDGWQNLRVGGHDPQGESYADFQRALKSYKQRGIILAIVSKNQQDIALEALDRHPEMVLKRSDFVGWRINWMDKVENIMDLLKELNLTPEAAVFLDDDPAERNRVQEALPGILVPPWPQNSLLYTKTLLSLSCFDTVFVSDDDRKRSEMYLQQKHRNALRGSMQNQQEWLASLKTTVTVAPLTSADLPRATQLLNKTNQMNLTTRRLSEQDFKAWSQAPNHRVWVFRVEDKLGDSGLTGIVSFEHDGHSARIVDFILSCRVFGRHIENVMVQTVIEQARRLNLRELKAVYVGTEKNQPCLDFLNERSVFHKTDGDTFIWDMDGVYPSSPHIIIRHAEG